MAVVAPGDLVPGMLLAEPAGGDGSLVEVVVFCHGDRLLAASRRCPHAGADLAEGIVSRGFVVCARHGWRFEAETGVAEHLPSCQLRTWQVEVVDAPADLRLSAGSAPALWVRPLKTP